MVAAERAAGRDMKLSCPGYSRARVTSEAVEGDRKMAFHPISVEMRFSLKIAVQMAFHPFPIQPRFLSEFKGSAAFHRRA